MNFKTYELLVIIVTYIFHASHSQAIQCCNLALQDSLNRVVLESNRVLTSGTFTALVLKICTTDPLNVQIWTLISDNNYKFKWQTLLTPTLNQTGYVSTIFTFSNNPVTIGPNDRLGLYSPTNQYHKINIPYTSGGLLSLSQTVFDENYVFTTSSTLSALNHIGSKTFSAYLNFCATPTSCLPLTGQPATPINPVYSNYITMPAVCCGTTQLQSCDVSGTVNTLLNNQNQQIQNLLTTITTLQNIINNYFNSVSSTGYCRDNTFKAGTYGLGFCYKLIFQPMTLAQAQIQCTLESSSRVVFIQSAIEDNFINTLLTNISMTGKISLWISAIYDVPSRQWYWFNNLLPNDNKQPFSTYRNWFNNIEPTPTSVQDVCATFVRDTTTNTFYWLKTLCTNTSYLLCKMPKLCY